MNKREILKQCLKNWFSDKMELQPTEDNLNILVDRIYYSKQLNLCGVGGTCCDKTIKHNDLLKDEFKDSYCNWCNRKIV
jgi:hypothetical protein